MRKVREIDPEKFVLDTPIIDQELDRLKVRIKINHSLGLRK